MSQTYSTSVILALIFLHASAVLQYDVFFLAYLVKDYLFS